MSSSQKVGFYRLPEVLALFPVSRSAWWRGVKEKKYPAPVKLSERCTAWRMADIHELLARISSQNAENEDGAAKPCALLKDANHAKA